MVNTIKWYILYNGIYYIIYYIWYFKYENYL